MDTGAIVAVTVQSMEGGDCASMPNTLDEAERQLGALDVLPREAGDGQGVSQQRDDEGAGGARVALLRQRAQPRAAQLEARPGGAATDLRQPPPGPR